ncbi:hypothetical protein [Treponema endosymbiont of Eucomonympha sp.]|uniref:hypothetical protein n=1 Tax=Treponema endosymbiont of Eucomonympha sp. TaxID=1580831 RepID=UPI000751A4AC|nr:hypothetical protein [Treponema endosymbiont of Eucomonympha sp.]
MLGDAPATETQQILDTSSDLPSPLGIMDIPLKSITVGSVSADDMVVSHSFDSEGYIAIVLSITGESVTVRGAARLPDDRQQMRTTTDALPAVGVIAPISFASTDATIAVDDWVVSVNEGSSGYVGIVISVVATTVMVKTTAMLPTKGAEIPYIGANGNWWVEDTDTGVKAQVPAGDKGDKGTREMPARTESAWRRLSSRMRRELPARLRRQPAGRTRPLLSRRGITCGREPPLPMPMKPHR